MAHFYLSDGATGTAPGSRIEVGGAEARHAMTVGRLRVGELLRIGDGNGTVAVGTVASLDADRFVVDVETVKFTDEPNPAVWLAQALAKGDRDELAIQAATELGVDGVIPWAAGRSIVQWHGPKVHKNEDRWRSILREASKQAMRHRIPSMRSLSSTADLARLGEEFQLVVLEPAATVPLDSFAGDGRDILLVVGPEGGISLAERELLSSAGASTMSLGRNVLRTSTAGPAAMAVLNTALHRW